MPGLDDQPGWATAVLMVMLPALVVPLGIVLVAVLALAARRPRTRRHCLDVRAQLTRYASRGKQ